jgi:hypothetical protein
MNKKHYALLSLTVLALASCSDRFRYPCQDPANSYKAECQCDQEPRTKNKALNGIESGITTTTTKKILGFDC